MVIDHPFRTSDCTEQEQSRPETERFIFRIATGMEQCLGLSKDFGITFRQVTDLPPISLHCAFEQGRRLADLRAALDRASTLTVMLCDYCDGGHEAKVLRAQINALGAEVQAIQRGGGRRRKTGRYWINLPAS